jgi:P4 family phage/plasmid primase-like protien
MTTSLATFCDKHNILWFPISLTITDDKTKILNPIHHPLYNGRPKMTDFKELDISIIKQRQSLLNDPSLNKILNTIAIDTNKVYHIDIDTPDYDSGFDEISLVTPYFKSMTKEYGKHILIKATDFQPESNRMQFKNKGVELLAGQWSYAPLQIFNADKDILELQNIKEMLMLKDHPKQNKMKTIVVTNDAEATESDITTETNENMSDIEYLLMECIQSNLCETGTQPSWSNVGQAIKNELQDEGVILFVDWTKKYGSENKKAEAFTHYTKYLKYTPLKNKKRLSIASLHYWAKLSNESMYNVRFKTTKINDDDVDTDIMNYIFEAGDYDYAKYFKKNWGFSFVCTDIEKKTFVEFTKDNLWKETKGGSNIRNMISNEMYNEFSKLQHQMLEEAKQYDPASEEHEKCHRTIKKIGEICIRFKKTSDKNNILREIMDLIINEQFLDDMNKVKNILPIKNGKILNVKTLEVTERTIEHKFNYECDAMYTELTEAEENDINQYFLDLFCQKQDMVDCVIDIFKSIFYGEKLRYIFFFTGSGCNGKSLLFKILQQIFKKSMNTIATNVILDLKQNNTITTEFEKLDKCLLGYVTELKDTDKLNEKTIKQISGGDPIDLRALFKTNVTINPTCNLCVLTNELPTFKKEKAIVDRIITIPFLNTFEVDNSFESKMMAKKDQIFSYIMKRGKILDKFKLTEDMIALKEEYVGNNENIDHLEDFIKDRFDIVPFVKTEKIVNNEFVKMYIEWLQIYKRKDDKITNKHITRRIKEFGINSKESNGKTYYLGLKLKEEIDEE